MREQQGHEGEAKHTSLASSRSHFLAELALVMVSRVVKVCGRNAMTVGTF